MSKIITFTDNDEALIAKIKEYQKAHGLSSFVAAVRKLCSDALEIAKIQHGLQGGIKNGTLSLCCLRKS